MNLQLWYTSTLQNIEKSLFNEANELGYYYLHFQNYAKLHGVYPLSIQYANFKDQIGLVLYMCYCIEPVQKVQNCWHPERVIMEKFLILFLHRYKYLNKTFDASIV